MSSSQPRGQSFAAAVVFLSVCWLPFSTAHAVTIDMVTVGNPGNAADTTGYGAVNYEYKIGKYEVTIGQYTEFLNAVAASDPNGLYNTSMGSSEYTRGISRSGEAGSYVYAPLNHDGDSVNRPITYVSWFNAARFANWMANGQPTGVQDSTTTENGAYDLSIWTSGTAPTRNATNPNTGTAPLFSLPTVNEWYKAAYFSPVLNSGSGGFWRYAAQADDAPGNTVGLGINQANWRKDGAYSLHPYYVADANYLTDVGAFSSSASYYGTFDQMGNVSEWATPPASTGSTVAVLGGDWTSWSADYLSSTSFMASAWLNPGSYDVVGFRLAAVPEPSTYAMALAGLACGGSFVWRRRKREHRATSLIAAASLAFAAACLVANPAHAVTIDMVTVGNPGNAADTTGYGAVNYEYKIGKYEVTIGQYTDFLNAVAKSDPYSLYNTSMATDLNIAGILRAGSSGSYTYSVISNGGNSANRPITYVSWWDAARFANWMQNGQGSGSTETGAYTLGGATSGNAPAVNPGATFYIPTEDQWYKAAYYSPVLNSGSGGYYKYATQSNTGPGNTIGNGANQANYWDGVVYSVTQDGTYENLNYLTDFGAFTNSASYYGTFDQSGNVSEWNDLTGDAGSRRGLRGGYWNSNWFDLPSSWGSLADPSAESYGAGFRLASPVAVPEPSTYAMVLAGLVCSGYSMRRREKRDHFGRSFITAASRAFVAVFLFTSPAHAVTIDMVTVGDAGNANASNVNGLGAVAYEYQIGKYEVTIGQYADFLNAVAKTDTYSLYNTSMATYINIAGISRSGDSGTYEYSVMNSSGHKPITYVSWFDAARFANWMANGQPTGSQGNATTENGAYNLNGVVSGFAPAKNEMNPNTSAAPTFYIPTQNEWYKAGFYSPNYGGVGVPGYYAYATQSDTAPGNMVGDSPNQANWAKDAKYAVTQDYQPNGLLLTDVGAFTSSASFYGTFDQSGSVYEWSGFSNQYVDYVGCSGGAWATGSDPWPLSAFAYAHPYQENPYFGFRLASPVAVPEPSTWVMGLAGIACAAWHVFRRRRR